ncbi:MAG: hypothetical protein K2K03_10425 [Prevotella sp.]|nr:hypothetical protein [Prevotella sp.]
MCRRAPHHVPTCSASCADVLRIMYRRAPHHAPTCSASCADALCIMYRWGRHQSRNPWRRSASKSPADMASLSLRV